MSIIVVIFIANIAIAIVINLVDLICRKILGLWTFRVDLGFSNSAHPEDQETEGCQSESEHGGL